VAALGQTSRLGDLIGVAFVVVVARGDGVSAR
jgi:hypothetical protein